MKRRRRRPPAGPKVRRTPPWGWRTGERATYRSRHDPEHRWNGRTCRVTIVSRHGIRNFMVTLEDNGEAAIVSPWDLVKEAVT